MNQTVSIKHRSYFLEEWPHRHPSRLLRDRRKREEWPHRHPSRLLRDRRKRINGVRRHRHKKS